MQNGHRTAEKIDFFQKQFFWNSTGFRQLRAITEKTLAAEKASFRQLKALTEKMLAAESLFLQFFSEFRPDLNFVRWTSKRPMRMNES